MFAEQFGSNAVVIALALAFAPAALRWWWGRALAERPDHPLIAERLLAHHSRVGIVVAGCLVALCVGWPTWMVWTVPVLLLAQMAASYPLTRTLYGETWSLAASVSFYTRLPIAIFGFWVLLGAAPWIAALAGPSDWVAAAIVAVVLLAWDRYYADVLRALLRSEPIADPVLLERFAALVAKSGIDPPRFECVPMRGGVLANALALASLRRSSVLFTDTLLSRLPADETVAICAHELAHLEYYDRSRLWRIQFGNWVLIAILCAVTPVTRALFASPHRFSLPAMACSAAVGVALMLRGRHRQRNETASDVRAIELTGDPEALARALTTLHAIARVPRRWDQQREQQATHPSLSRRIRDIHAAAGTATPVAIEQTAVFHAARGDAIATFDNAHLHWQDAPGTMHRIEYGTLSELRLQVSMSGDASLIAVERQGRRWTMPIRPEDAGPLQSILDAVDGRLADHVPAAAISAPVARFVAIFGCALATTLGQFPLALVAIVAALAPGAAVLTATGSAALVTAAVVLAQGSGGASVHAGLALVLALLGAGFLALAHTRRADDVPPAPLAIAVIAVSALLATAGIALGGIDAVRLHQGARALTAAPVLLVALAAACWGWRGRPQVRYAALAAALTGLAIVAIGSTTFLDLIGRDLFLVKAAPLRWAGVEAASIGSFDVPFEIDSLRLSPGGRLAAVVRTEPEDGRTPAAPPVFHVRHGDGNLAVLDAFDLAFIDDRRVLRLALNEAGAEIAVASFDGAPAMDWRERVPDIRSATIAYSGTSHRWILVGRDAEGRVVRATGTVGRAGFDRVTWKGVADLGGWINATATRGDAAIAFQQNYGYGILSPAFAVRLPTALLHTYPESRLWRLGPGARVEAGRSLLDVTCFEGALDDESVVCTAFDGSRTRILAVDPSTAAVTALGMIDGRFYADHGGAPGWLTGWWHGAPRAIHLHTRLGLRLPTQRDEYVDLVAPAERVIGTATTVEGGTRVRLYPLTPPMLARARDK